MSNDKDFFRYNPKVPTIISDYDFDKKGRMRFEYKKRPIDARMSSPRELIKPLP